MNKTLLFATYILVGLCLASVKVFAGGPCSGLTVKVTSVYNPPCSYSGGGSASVMASGGTAPYTYSWSPAGGTSNAAANLTGGTYIVTVQDSNGCTTTIAVEVDPPPPLTVNVLSIKNISCFGGTDGCVSVCFSGGTPPYKYTWSSGDTSATVCGLSAGTYNVTVYDYHSCMAWTTVSLTQPSKLIATASTKSNVTCYGGNDGSANVTASGGTPGYNYLWLPGGNTSATATGLTAGTYTCTITDKNGCPATATATITQCYQSVKVSSIAYATCGIGNGSASVTASSCTPPYSFSWSNGRTGSSVTGLSGGTYSVTVTNGSGCKASTSFVLGSGGPSVSISSYSNVSCNGMNNGSINVIASGGIPPYTYAWTTSPVQTNASATGLSPGTYWCQVTDKNGCVGGDSVTITEPAPLTFTDSAFTTNCKNNNGSASVYSAGGTSPYTYLWSNGQTGTTATGLSAGTYTCSVTDNNGCVYSASVMINMSSVNVSITYTGTNCSASSDGTATASASGGTAPYSYSWSTGQTSAHLSLLSAGTYTCTATDKNGCTGSDTVTITHPSPITLTITDSGTTCGFNNGYAMASASGGTSCSGNYYYTWAPGARISQYIGNLSAGTYTCVVTDQNGCKAIDSAIIKPSIGPIVSTIKQINLLCYGASNGEATISVTSGVLPYTYTWTPTGGNKDSADNLSAGTYTCSVTDSTGCINKDVITITQPAQLSLKSGSVSATSGCNGKMWVTVTGGTGPYLYSWCTGATTDTVKNACAGTCCCTVTDKNGCIDTACAIVSLTSGLNEPFLPYEGITLYPNPASNILSIRTSEAYSFSLLEVCDMAGRNLLTKRAESGTGTDYTLDISGLSDGIYILSLQGPKGQRTLKFSVIKRY